MHIHILGICGTFMGGLALVARQLGHDVSGTDQGIYPPMSTQLAEAGIGLNEGFSAQHIQPRPDLVIIGNALSRGNVEVEAVLSAGIPYTSGAQWLAENVLYQDRWTLAVAGTHGKTSTTSMLAWILEHAGLNPGFLVGGVPNNFGLSARLGEQYFVIEADEYDTAFFDKRSKFVHYRPRTAILNNLEYDHADIFPDLDAIKRQFHHLVRTVPGNGELVVNGADSHLQQVLEQGCWSGIQRFGAGQGMDWSARPLNPQASRFEVLRQNKTIGEVSWSMIGEHNMLNAIAAVAAAAHAGVNPATALDALAQFRGIKRRMEVRGQAKGITIYDDFAHHPTEIAATLSGLRRQVGKSRVIAVMEPRSNTMRMGHHTEELAGAFADADLTCIVVPENANWESEPVMLKLGERGRVYKGTSAAVADLPARLSSGDHVVVMSNGGFDNIHERLLQALK